MDRPVECTRVMSIWRPGMLGRDSVHSTFPTRFFIAMAACLGLFGSTSVAAGAQEGGVRSRELVRDPGILVVRVFEADGSPSPQRTLSLIAGTDETGGAALGTDFGEGEERGPGEVRTGDDGRAHFERTNSLSRTLRYTGDTQVQLWVSAGHRVIHRQTFDLATTLELEVHLAEQSRVIVSLLLGAGISGTDAVRARPSASAKL